MANVAILGMQWGDEGKGKIVDLLSEEADIVCRFQGGSNAGHTVFLNGKKVILHLVPSGILHDNTVCVIGNGVAFDPELFFKELEEIQRIGVDVSCDRLFISERAHVVMPYHKRMDTARDKKLGKSRIGTTGRGIGPTYEDKAARIGIRVVDLLNENIFKEKLKRNLELKNLILEKFLGDEGFEFEPIYEKYLLYGRRLKKFARNISSYLNEQIKKGKKILFEGAQGALLDIDHGTYPYVTSSSTVAGNIFCGCGVSPRCLDRILGVVKAYTTRVGGGPFPTEMEKDLGDYVRERGKEFGATTGRPRRCGWLDIVALRHAISINGLSGIVITKLDVLDDLDEINICYAYKYGEKVIEDFPADINILSECKPQYETFRGWKRSTTSITSFNDLPDNAKNYLRYLEKSLKVDIDIISVGPERRNTIFLKDPFSN